MLKASNCKSPISTTGHPCTTTPTLKQEWLNSLMKHRPQHNSLIKRDCLQTSGKRRGEHVCRLIDKTALPRHTDGCERVVPCDHSACKMRRTQRLYSRSGTGFEPVLKDDKSQELEPRLCLFSSGRLAYH